MSVAEFVLVVGDFMEEWVNTPRGWKWRSFTKLTLPIADRRNSLYDELVESVKKIGDLDCASSNLVISYLMHSKQKMNPTIINNDACVSLYMMDVDVDGFRPVLRINVVDRHISITNAFSRVYNSAYHGLCIRHLAENLRVNQQSGEHLYLFYATAKEYSFDEFIENFEELKYNFPEAAHVLENVLGFEKWSRAHFLGNRYDVMTTNITESLNSVLMDEREYPMLYTFNSISKKFGKKFRERYAYVDGIKNIFVPCAEKILRNNESANDSLYVTNPNGVVDQYTVFGNGVTAKVNRLERSYSCRKFDLVKIPCEHAMTTL
ncbi:hypothetical protein T459_17829 [Capsicum annuum]|uniref:Zinc finger PMZ-type domain-containing protein n=1 Tax=Capsicum annuum TaxID=4072 RepID=A0A2G2ZCN1_CAPAN|nr:hypothetical protein T459_17829 [Capsicum annuum]